MRRPKRICNDCGLEKDLKNDFYPRRAELRGSNKLSDYLSRCKDCHGENNLFNQRLLALKGLSPTELRERLSNLLTRTSLIREALRKLSKSKETAEDYRALLRGARFILVKKLPLSAGGNRSARSEYEIWTNPFNTTCRMMILAVDYSGPRYNQREVQATLLSPLSGEEASMILENISWEEAS